PSRGPASRPRTGACGRARRDVARTPAGPPRGGERTVHHDRSEAPQHRHLRPARRRLAEHGRRLPPPRPRCHVAGVGRLAGRRTRRARGRAVRDGDGGGGAADAGGRMRPAVMPPPTFEPVEPELYEAAIGPAAGCLVGLAIGVAMWASMIVAAWWIWTIVTR